MACDVCASWCVCVSMWRCCEQSDCKCYKPVNSSIYINFFLTFKSSVLPLSTDCFEIQVPGDLCSALQRGAPREHKQCARTSVQRRPRVRFLPVDLRGHSHSHQEPEEAEGAAGRPAVPPDRLGCFPLPQERYHPEGSETKKICLR